MKKILSILGSVGLIATAGATVVACGKTPQEEPISQLNLDQLNEKIVKYAENYEKWIDGLQDPKNPTPEEVKQAVPFILEIGSFYAQVFLETEYIVVNPDVPPNLHDYGQPTKVKKAENDQEYQDCLKEVIYTLDDYLGENVNPIIRGDKEIHKVFGDYKEQLEKK